NSAAVRRKVDETAGNEGGGGIFCWWPRGAPPFMWRSALEAGEEGRGVPAIASHGLDFGIELVDQRGQRQLAAIGAGLGPDDAAILAHPVDGEAEIGPALNHVLRTVLHLPGLRGALTDDVDHRGHVETGGGAEMDGFGETLDDSGDGNLVHHLGELAGAG